MKGFGQINMFSAPVLTRYLLDASVGDYFRFLEQLASDGVDGAQSCRLFRQQLCCRMKVNKADSMRKLIKEIFFRADDEADEKRLFYLLDSLYRLMAEPLMRANEEDGQGKEQIRQRLTRYAQRVVN